MAQYSDEQVKEIYEDLKSDLPTKPETNPLPQKWTASEYSTARGYAKRVAKSSNLDEFSKFLETGQPVHPVKMTPAEMEVLMGGNSFHEWAALTVMTVGIGVACAMCT